MEDTSERPGWRRWGGKAALAVGGMLVGGVLAGTLTASAANPASTANQSGAYAYGALGANGADFASPSSLDGGGQPFLLTTTRDGVRSA